jgi:hypothetical protein
VFLDDGGERLEVVADAGTRLAVREKDRANARVADERVAQRGGVDRIAPLGIHTHDVDAVGGRDARPQLAEPAHRAEHRLLAWAEQVRDRCLERARSAGRHEQDVVLGPQPVLQARRAVAEQLREFRAARIDHLIRHGASDARRQPARAGQEQVVCHRPQ